MGLDKPADLVYNISMTNNERENNMNNVSTEAGRTEATIRIRKENRLQLRMLEHAKAEMWELWGKTNSQIGRDCILQGIVAASREIEKLEYITK